MQVLLHFKQTARLPKVSHSKAGHRPALRQIYRQHVLGFPTGIRLNPNSEVGTADNADGADELASWREITVRKNFQPPRLENSSHPCYPRHPRFLFQFSGLTRRRAMSGNGTPRVFEDKGKQELRLRSPITKFRHIGGSSIGL